MPGELAWPRAVGGWEVSTAACGQLSLEFMEHAAAAGLPGRYLPGKFQGGNPVVTYDVCV